MKRVISRILSLIIISILVVVSSSLVGCGCFSTAPTPTETQFIVEGGKIYQLDIYANKGQTIKGSWKSDKAVYRWWTNPGGAAYPLETYAADSKITGVFEPTPLDPEPGFWIEGQRIEHSMAGMSGGDISIKCDRPYGESGYYTICFMPFPYDTQEIVNITVYYWLE